MKNRNDGTHEPGLRRAGAPDPVPEVDQAELDALAARVAALETTVGVHSMQLPVYSAQIGLLSAKMEQRKDTLVRVGTGADVALVDTGPRYMLQAWKMTAQGPTAAAVLQVKSGDATRLVARFRDVLTNTPPLEEFSPDRVPGYWFDSVVLDGQLQQLTSDDWSTEVGMNFLGFFERPGALKRQYLLKAVTGGNGGDGTPVPIPMMGARVGDTVYTVAGNDMGSIARLFNDGGNPFADPLREVPLHPDNDLFETTVTVDDQIQQISADDLTGSTFLFFLCRDAAGEAAEPRDYILSMAVGNNGAGAVSCPRGFLGDVVESVIRLPGGPAYTHSMEHAEDQFETTISNTDQIQQTGADDLSIDNLLMLLSRPASAPTLGTPAPISVPGAVASDVVANAFLVDQESGELAELYPVSDYFEETVSVNNQIQQIAGQLDGKAIAFVLKHIFPDP